MQGFAERGNSGDLGQLQSTMHAIELACTSIQVKLCSLGVYWYGTFRVDLLER